MNKLIIPTILTATILVAGIFAFMPVQQATTVHTTGTTTLAAGTFTTIGLSSINLAMDLFDASAINVVDGMEIEITSTVDYCIQSLQVHFIGIDADDDLNISSIEINDIPLTAANGADLNVLILTDQGVSTTLITDIVDGLDNALVLPGGLCADSGETSDMILNEAGVNANGDIIAGELNNVFVMALQDGDGTLTVTLGAAD